MKRLILVAAISAVAACGNAESSKATPAPAQAAPTALILECDVKLIAFEGNEITQRRTYKIDLVAKTLRFWQGDSGEWVNGGSESRLTFETPSNRTFESNMTLGHFEQTNVTSFDRAIGAVEGSLRLRSDTSDRTTRFAGPCKVVDAPGQNNAF